MCCLLRIVACCVSADLLLPLRLSLRQPLCPLLLALLVKLVLRIQSLVLGAPCLP